MPIVKTEAYEMDRRQLLKLTGTMGIGVTFISPAELLAAGMCEKIVIDNGGLGATQAGAHLQFWIDGLHFAERTNVASRANITLFMDLTQTSVSHVESVVLVDDAKRTIGARYFDASMRMTDKHVPYVRFENVEIDYRRIYTCIYTVRSGSKVKLFTATINDKKSGHVEVSRLNTTWLPQKMRDDFKTFLVSSEGDKPNGLITTQFQYYTQNGLTNHCARGKVVDIGSDGSFKINVEFMHGGEAAVHYMRYFIVMDPVGRLLGFHKRDFNDPKKNDAINFVAGSAVDVVALNDDPRKCWNGDPNLRERDVNPAASAATADNLVPLTDVRRQTAKNKVDFYNVPSLQIADIRDCPYVQFYTEDSYDAIARNMIRLR